MKAKSISIIRNKNKSDPLFITYIFFIWAILMALAVFITVYTPSKVKNRYYDDQIKASILAQEAMEKIKERRIELNIPLIKEDKYESGLLGEWFSDITTTSGIVGAKRTAINPNFAAVYIDMFKQAGIKKGDQIALIMSGSFPSLNISAMAAAQVYELDVCIMSSIGSSTYGANLTNFTFFDMAEYLYHENIFTNRIDYVSFGGANDDGYEFPTEVRKEILSRIEASGVPFLCNSNFKSNVEERTKLIFEKCPDTKLLISVGGTLVAMGRGEFATTTYCGLVTPSYLNTNRDVDYDKIGLLDTFLKKDIPVIQMLNVKGIALEYAIDYDPDVIPDIGTSDAYYEVSYNLFIPIMAIVISIGILVFYYIYRKKKV